MSAELDPGFEFVDRRASAGDDGRAPASGDGAGRNATDRGGAYHVHSALLGYCSEERVGAFLRDGSVHPDALDSVVQHWQQAQARVGRLSPLTRGGGIVPIETDETLAAIGRVMARPECRSAFPDGTWAPAFVDVAQLVPVRFDLDLQQAESLEIEDLNPDKPGSAVPLCFPESGTSAVEVAVDQVQKSITVGADDAAFEVMGLRYSRQDETGPLVVSFMLGAPPPLVVVLRYADRLFLTAGAARVYRLMQAGFTQVPCVLRDAASLAQILSSHARGFREAALAAPRPPLLPDFADPVLGVIVKLRATRRLIRIRPDEFSAGL
jgi:hypothetical protein